MVSVGVLQLICSAAVSVVCFIGGVVPIKLNKRFEGGNFLSYSNCLSAGILLGASLVHLLTDAEENASDSYEYPIAHFLCGIGFFAAFLLENVIGSHNHGEGGSHDHGKHSKEHVHDHSDDSIDSQEEIELENISHSSSNEEQDEEKGDQVGLTDNRTEKPKLSYLLLAVLSLESFISGTALGVSDSSLAILVLAFAILAHIWAESFALTTNFLKQGATTNQLYKIMIMFSLITPISVICGVGLKSILEGTAAKLVSSFLQAFAAGTFLFVALCEIIPEEFEHSHGNKTKKVLLLSFGYLFMSALAYWI